MTSEIECLKARNWMNPKYSVKIVAATTSQATIHGKLVPGNGLKMKATNQPVALENNSLTRSSTDWAKAALEVSASPSTPMTASSFLLYI